MADRFWEKVDLLCVPSCFLAVDSEARQLCLSWNEAAVDYWRRCGIDEASIAESYDAHAARCDKARGGDYDAMRACIADLKSAECGRTRVSCAALEYWDW